ncbi:MAG: Eco57I restriction-modification methylase domain-containing protein [Acidobacteriia bacterium]|nr:Eco57I restriction-modification methylase domain-containing protein [Terriglobia bacterium]
MGIVASHSTEGRRQIEQARLDELKTPAERNKWGQFATPPKLALNLASYARELAGEGAIRFLDPAIGTGSFYSALTAAFPPQRIEAAMGIELDPLFVEAATDLWGESGLHLLQGDFTKQRAPERLFNLVLTNPPYVRHHHLSAAEKSRLKTQVARALHLEISGLAGLYCYFMLLSHDWMEEQGLAVWLVPSEFMDVNYGETLRRYLTERVTLLHIHRFCPTDVQFTDALVSSAVVVFRKSPPPSGHHTRFSFAGSIDAPQSQACVPLDMLKRSHKWTRFPAMTTLRESVALTLGDLFTIKRGLATGSNSFFIMTGADIKEWHIPDRFLKPILPGPRHLTTDIIEALPDGAPAVSPQLHLLDCSEPEDKIKERWPRFYEYLKHGRAQNVHAAYLSSHRTPWYSQEQRPPAPFLCTYMGRARNGKHPLRFIWNRSQATAHNVYLMLYPHGRLRNALQKHPELEARVFEALQRITPDQVLSEGRVYGGGLHKVEPKELAQIAARPVLEAIEAYVRIEQQEQLFA